jgi:large conductance mechanosensitive channel
MLKGFKEFILRGSVVDLAVGVVVGAAFNGIISSMVKDLITPFIAAIIKAPDFSGLYFTINGSKFLYGDFLNSLVSFLIIATVVYFFVVVPINKLSAKLHKGPPQDAVTKKCPECMSEIPIGAKRCAYCTCKVK